MNKEAKASFLVILPRNYSLLRAFYCIFYVFIFLVTSFIVYVALFVRNKAFRSILSFKPTFSVSINYRYFKKHIKKRFITKYNNFLFRTFLKASHI